jgi:cysteine desulfurase / selenocysteine lyase
MEQLLEQQFPQVISARKSGMHYLDSAAMTQTPRVCTDALLDWYSSMHGNVHRSEHSTASATTIAFENSRKTVQQFIKAKNPEEICFTKNATEAMNIIAQSWGMQNLQSGDTIAITIAEHHSCIVPWQKVCKSTGAKIIWVPITKNGYTDVDALTTIVKEYTCKAVIHTALSNVLGVKNDITTITNIAHAHNALSIIDATQYAAHAKIDVQSIDCDVLIGSGYKLYGPTGVGFLYCKKVIADVMQSFMGGGMMIETVTIDGYTDSVMPYKFEAGTPPIAEVIGLASSIRWLETLPLTEIYTQEENLLGRLNDELKNIPSITVLGGTILRSNCISFYHDRLHAHDFADILAQHGVAVRAGTHCAQPLHNFLHYTASVRASIGMYTTEEDCIALINAIHKITTTLHE